MSRGAGKVAAKLRAFFEENPRRTVHTFEVAALVFRTASDLAESGPLELSTAEIVSTRRALYWLRRKGLAFPVGYNRQGRRIWAGRQRAIQSAARELEAFGSGVAVRIDAELLAAISQKGAGNEDLVVESLSGSCRPFPFYEQVITAWQRRSAAINAFAVATDDDAADRIVVRPVPRRRSYSASSPYSRPPHRRNGTPRWSRLRVLTGQPSIATWRPTPRTCRTPVPPDTRLRRPLGRCEPTSRPDVIGGPVKGPLALTQIDGCHGLSHGGVAGIGRGGSHCARAACLPGRRAAPRVGHHTRHLDR